MTKQAVKATLLACRQLRAARDTLVSMIGKHPYPGTLEGAVSGIECALDELSPRRKDALPS